MASVGLSMAERKAVTKQMALRYRRATKADKGVMLGELCALTGWHRDYAPRARRTAAAALRTIHPCHRRLHGNPEEALDGVELPGRFHGLPGHLPLKPIWAQLLSPEHRLRCGY